MHRGLLTLGLALALTLTLALAAEEPSKPGPARGVGTHQVSVIASWPAQEPAPNAAVSWTVTATPYGTTSGEPLPAHAPVSVSGSAPGPLRLDLRQDWFWRVEATAPGYWVQPALLAAPVLAHELRLLLRPAGRVRGRLVLPAGAAAPKEITLGIEATPELVASQANAALRNLTRALPSARVPCALEAGAFTCTVPAGRLDLALRVDGFLAHYRWGLEVPRGSAVELGALALVKGAAVSGWVVSVPPAPGVPAQVELTPLGLEGAREALTSARRENQALTTAVDSRGFFHLTGVPAGSYTLTATKKGFAAARQAGVQVFSDRETRLVQPIELAPPRVFELFVDPPASPNGEPWRVELGQLRPGTNYLDRVTAAPEPAPGGVWRSSAVPPGRYKLRVVDATGAPWWHEDVELSPLAEPVRVTLPLLEVAGAVRLGKEPLAHAEVHFGGRTGATRRTFRTDEDGAFAGWLPHGGRWRVDVEAAVPPVFRRWAALEVEPLGPGPARVVLNLPATALHGAVVDARGAPAAGAWVGLFPLDPREAPTQVRADDRGRFELRGFSPGRLTLEAERPGESSSPVGVELLEGREVGPLRLVLRATKPLTGTVIVGRQPVAGARVTAHPVGAQAATAGVGPVATAVSGLDGAFELALPAWLPAFVVQVAAPGFTLRQVPVPERPAEPLVIALAQDGGAVRLRAETPFARRSAEAPSPLVWVDGAPLAWSLAALRLWAEAHGVAGSDPRELLVPHLPPGALTVCTFASFAEHQQALVTGPPGGDRCASGWVGAGGEAELVVREGG